MLLHVAQQCILEAELCEVAQIWVSSCCRLIVGEGLPVDPRLRHELALTLAFP